MQSKDGSTTVCLAGEFRRFLENPRVLFKAWDESTFSHSRSSISSEIKGRKRERGQGVGYPFHRLRIHSLKRLFENDWSTLRKAPIYHQVYYGMAEWIDQPTSLPQLTVPPVWSTNHTSGWTTLITSIHGTHGNGSSTAETPQPCHRSKIKVFKCLRPKLTSRLWSKPKMSALNQAVLNE